MRFWPLRLRPGVTAAIAAAALCVLGRNAMRVDAQQGSQFMGSADDVAIAYSTGPLNNVVEDLNRRLDAGSTALRFEGRSGFLQSVLEALTLPTDSQLLVFTQLSLQGRMVSPGNPRALFFNDRAALGWVRGAELIEIAAHDQTAGVVFYTLEQRPSERPRFAREFRCLGCHMSGNTLGVPGLMAFSTMPGRADQQEKIVTMDHRSPLQERWGGWFVTGESGAVPHLGNRVPSRPGAGGALQSLSGLFNPEGFQGPSSDIAALMTFSHQTHLTNLLTRASWEARAADPALHPGSVPAAGQRQRVETMMNGVATEVVDYMLFVDEAPLPNPVRGSSGFAARMSASGPRDRRGRSLYELDLQTRLLKYPCSYLIYSPAFDALPPLAKAPIYRRMWQVLSGEAAEPRYRALALADRRAIVEILRETKPDLPSYFQRVTR
jgi:hypothetical protein